MSFSAESNKKGFRIVALSVVGCSVLQPLSLSVFIYPHFFAKLSSLQKNKWIGGYVSWEKF